MSDSDDPPPSSPQHHSSKRQCTDLMQIYKSTNCMNRVDRWSPRGVLFFITMHIIVSNIKYLNVQHFLFTKTTKLEFFMFDILLYTLCILTQTYSNVRTCIVWVISDQSNRG